MVTLPPSALDWDMSALFAAKECCDLTISVDGTAFSAHAAVVAARSAPLRSMLLEATPDGAGHRHIQLLNASPVAFEVVLEFMYSDRLDRRLTMDKIYESQLQVRFLKIDRSIFAQGLIAYFGRVCSLGAI